MGAKVVIADVSDERGEALAREVGAGSLYVPTDCMDKDAIARRAGERLQAYGDAAQAACLIEQFAERQVKDRLVAPRE